MCATISWYFSWRFLEVCHAEFKVSILCMWVSVSWQIMWCGFSNDVVKFSQIILIFRNEFYIYDPNDVGTEQKCMNNLCMWMNRLTTNHVHFKFRIKFSNYESWNQHMERSLETKYFEFKFKFQMISLNIFERILIMQSF